MSDEALYEKIAAYFSDRPGVVETHGFWDFHPAINAAVRCLEQKILYDGLEIPKSWDIVFENMIGYPEDRLSYIDALYKTGRKIISDIHKSASEDIEILTASVMVNGSSRPIRFEYKLHPLDIERAVYIKSFNALRLFGLELYHLFGGMDDEYSFAFNKGIIIEQGVKGKHEFDLPLGIPNKKLYCVERINADLLSFTIGLDDLSKLDNYLITPEGRIALIDFDVMEKYYEEEVIEAIKQNTAEDLEISMDQYNEIYAARAANLRDRVVEQKSEVDRLIAIMEDDDDHQIHELGEYIRRNIEALTADLNS